MVEIYVPLLKLEKICYLEVLPIVYQAVIDQGYIHSSSRQTNLSLRFTELSLGVAIFSIRYLSQVCSFLNKPDSGKLYI